MGYTKKEDGLGGLAGELEEGKRVQMVHLEMVREDRCLYGPERITSPDSAVRMAGPLSARADREMMVVMGMTVQMEPISVEVVAVGGLDTCMVDVRNIFKHALLCNAACIMCSHDHPSGSPGPSREDSEMTGRIQEAGRILGIRLVDHIIISTEGYHSFREHGMAEDGPGDPYMGQAQETAAPQRTG